jgi:hypothetical protein
MRQKHTRSCGCLVFFVSTAQATKHGGRRDPEYRIWKHMKSRCGNPHDLCYHQYGARDIFVCDEWLHDYARFIADMGHRPSPEHSIERINNNGPYASWNCKWATRKEQANNKRNNVFATVGGRRLTIPQWAETIGVPVSRLRWLMYHRGMTPEQSVTTTMERVRG